jgi:conjugal transfer pilus assembly protein TraK
MHKNLIGVLLLTATAIHANVSIPVKDNSDIALALSQNNYNRLVIKNDKIMDAVFPPNTMAIKRDEQDGSAYIMLASQTPFTLFLTTEKGHHLSVTLKPEEALGKTIELIPQTAVVTNSVQSALKTAPAHHEEMPEEILSMISDMERHTPQKDITIKHQYGRAERRPKGLTLLPKEIWQNKNLTGEIIELYNASSEPLELSQEWFTEEGTKAIKLTSLTLKRHEKAMLYRIQGATHG